MNRMPISAGEKNDAILYINEKLNDIRFPTPETHAKAYNEFCLAIRHKETSLAEVNAWADKYLDQKAWKRLRDATSKRRRANQRNVRIRASAYYYLSSIAKQTNVSMLDVIEKLCKREWEKIVKG